MRTTMIGLIVIGIIVWVVAAIIGLLLNADAKFLWTCVTGAGLGFVGIFLTIRRAKKSGL